MKRRRSRRRINLFILTEKRGNIKKMGATSKEFLLGMQRLHAFMRLPLKFRNSISAQGFKSLGILFFEAKTYPGLMGVLTVRIVRLILPYRHNSKESITGNIPVV